MIPKTYLLSSRDAFLLHVNVQSKGHIFPSFSSCSTLHSFLGFLQLSGHFVLSAKTTLLRTVKKDVQYLPFINNNFKLRNSLSNENVLVPLATMFAWYLLLIEVLNHGRLVSTLYSVVVASAKFLFHWSSSGASEVGSSYVRLFPSPLLRELIKFILSHVIKFCWCN